jgi:hypothetical protein
MLLNAELSHGDIETAIKQFVERNTNRKAIKVTLRKTDNTINGEPVFTATVTTDEKIYYTEQQFGPMYDR